MMQTMVSMFGLAGRGSLQREDVFRSEIKDHMGTIQTNIGDLEKDAALTAACRALWSGHWSQSGPHRSRSRWGRCHTLPTKIGIEDEIYFAGKVCAGRPVTDRGAVG